MFKNEQNIDMKQLLEDLTKSSSTPQYTNIGGVERQKSKIGDVSDLENGYKLDYLAFTISDEYSFQQLLNELRYSIEDFKESYGKYFYNSGITIDNYISIYYNSDSKPVSKNSSKTVNFVFTGTGCTDLAIKFENDIYKIFEILYSFEASITRIDLAYDDFYGLLDFDRIESKLNNGEYVSSKKSFNIVKSSNINHARLGQTIYIGSARSSNKHSTFFKMYDKRAEYIGKKQQLMPIVEETGIWQRYEITFKKSKAHEVFLYLLFDAKYKHNVDLLYKENLRGIVEFLDVTYTRNGDIQDKKRWSVCDWWDDFLKYDDKLTFKNHERDADLGRTLHWVKKAVVPNLKMLEIIFNQFDCDLYDVLKKLHHTEFTKKQHRIMNSVENLDKDKFNSYLCDFWEVKDEDLPKK